MSQPGRAQDDQVFVERAVEAAIRIGLIVLLVGFCLAVLRPFIVVVVWGAILATASYPAYEKGVELLGGRSKLTAGLFVLAGIVLLIIPTIALSSTALDGIRFVADDLKAGKLSIPAAPEQIASWPLIGERLSNFWNLASQNLQAAAVELKPQLIALGSWLLSTATSAAFALLQFVFSILVAGVMLANAQGGGRMLRALASRLAGERGAEFADLAGATVRSVAQGVIGVALIQSTLAGIAFIIVGVPAAGLWALLVLIGAIVQLPTLLILGPIVVYVFYTASTATAVVFAIWSIAVGASDNVLKPLLLGRGLEVPMLVILLGAIGGLVGAGIIGLFIGSVGLALGYQLFTAWISEAVEGAAPAEG